MNFEKTLIEGAYIVTRSPYEDFRGSFARLYCEREYLEAGIKERFRQINLCCNLKKGTLRGLHYQKGGKAEDKVVACINGKIFDVCVDLRKDSQTFGRYISEELSGENGKMLYIPKGCAHGYVTLEDCSQLLYLMSEFYIPGLEAGYKYDDPAFSIKWPLKSGLIISDKDLALPYSNKEVR